MQQAKQKDMRAFVDQRDVTELVAKRRTDRGGAGSTNTNESISGRPVALDGASLDQSSTDTPPALVATPDNPALQPGLTMTHISGLGDGRKPLTSAGENIIKAACVHSINLTRVVRPMVCVVRC